MADLKWGLGLRYSRCGKKQKSTIYPTQTTEKPSKLQRSGDKRNSQFYSNGPLAERFGEDAQEKKNFERDALFIKFTQE